MITTHIQKLGYEKQIQPIAHKNGLISTCFRVLQCRYALPGVILTYGMAQARCASASAATARCRPTTRRTRNYLPSPMTQLVTLGTPSDAQPVAI